MIIPVPITNPTVNNSNPPPNDVITTIAIIIMLSIILSLPLLFVLWFSKKIRDEQH